jgi:queuine tRNA-ribosyltransferase
MPSRHARHGMLFTRRGVIKIKNARYRDDPRPVDEACSCPLCSRQSRAFLHHLVRAREITGSVLATLHNIRYYLDFMADLRDAVKLGTLQALAEEIAQSYADGGPAQAHLQ